MRKNVASKANQKYELCKKRNTKTKVKRERNREIWEELSETKSGITLIALVITVIVMLILAGVAMSAITNPEGIFSEARKAGENYNQASKNEADAFNILMGKVEEELLPENTPETEAGTIVKTPEEWKSETVSYISTETGKEVTNVTKIPTVYAVAVGNGETVPIPYGFYYVGGNLTTGVVISDNEDDKYNGTDRTDHSYATQLKGNQFVWIPCTIDNYKKIDFGLTNATGWDTSTNTAEETQIQKYGGFYVGRYEAGTSEIKGIDFTKAATTTSWWLSGYEYTNVTSGNVTSKAGEIPYYHTNYWTAVEMSRRMINTNYAHSGLMTGTMYDVMLHYMSDDKPEGTEEPNADTAYTDLKTTPWGNYSDTTLTGCTGQYSIVDSSTGSNEAWTANTTGRKEGSTSVMLTTGSTDAVKKRNIYDVAGNLWEWTQESSYYSDSSVRYNIRGGTFNHASTGGPACLRNWRVPEGAGTACGFRVALYLK